MSSSVVTRFPPSPTGFLHIGGARTALFNWAFAKHHGGRMLLRIEDTDRERSSEHAVQAIFDSLEWLGLDWSGEPVFQHTRAGRHVEIAEQLLSAGGAYRCYCSPEEISAMRERAKADGRAPRYDGTCRDRAAREDGAPFAVRFKAPETGKTVIQDRVQGDVTIANEQLDDLVILRSDGTPTYMLSVVVDDYDMGVNHVIRGDDHLTNTARQILIYQALGWALPVFAHIPLIHGPDGAKLSKRHGALSVTAYRDMGFLPEAMRNYLARLGWSHGDEEIFSTQQLIEWFDFDAIGRSPARFDLAKLENLNAHYMRAMDNSELLDRLVAHMPLTDFAPDWPQRLDGELKQRLIATMPALKERSKTLSELALTLSFVFAARPITMNEKASALLSDDARALLSLIATDLAALTDWSKEAIESTLRNLASSNELKLGKIAQPLRAVLTGTTVSPGIFDVLYILQRDEAIARIWDQTTA